MEIKDLTYIGNYVYCHKCMQIVYANKCRHLEVRNLEELFPGPEEWGEVGVFVMPVDTEG